MEYEICYLIGESKEADLDKIRPNIEAIIKKHKGTLLEGEFVKKRRLAYEIKREARGTFVAKRFTVPSKDEREEKFPDYDIMGEINKELRFNQEIIRYMIVKTDDLISFEELRIAQEKAQGQAASRDFKREDGPRKFEKKPMARKEVFRKPKEEVKEVAKEEIKKEVPAPKSASEEPVKKEEIEEVVQEVVKKETKKKIKEVKKAKEDKIEKKESKKKVAKKEEGILGDDIDEKLDEILNI